MRPTPVSSWLGIPPWLSAAIGVVLMALLAAIGIVGAVNARLDLFDDYRAGYQAGEVGRSHTPDPGVLCRKAVRAAYPDQFVGLGPDDYPGTDVMVAFSVGCVDRLSYRRADPWRVRDAFARGGD
jgi:hypothetical protein